MSPQEYDDNELQTPTGAKARVLALLSGVAQVIPGLSSSPRSRWTALVIACTTSIGGVLLVWLIIIAGSGSSDSITMPMVLETLDSGAYTEAHKMAKELQEQGTLSPLEMGGPLFAMGAAACYEADSTWSKRKTAHYLAAARYLEEARDRGLHPTIAREYKSITTAR